MSRSFHPTTCKDVIRNSALTSRRAETNDSSLILILRNEAGHKLWGRERETEREWRVMHTEDHLGEGHVAARPGGLVQQPVQPRPAHRPVLLQVPRLE